MLETDKLKTKLISEVKELIKIHSLLPFEISGIKYKPTIDANEQILILDTIFSANDSQYQTGGMYILGSYNLNDYFYPKEVAYIPNKLLSDTLEGFSTAEIQVNGKHPINSESLAQAITSVENLRKNGKNIFKSEQLLPLDSNLHLPPIFNYLLNPNHTIYQQYSVSLQEAVCILLGVNPNKASYAPTNNETFIGINSYQFSVLLFDGNEAVEMNKFLDLAVENGFLQYNNIFKRLYYQFKRYWKQIAGIILAITTITTIITKLNELKTFITSGALLLIKFINNSHNLF